MENQRIRLTKKLLKDALIGLLEEKRIDEISIKELTAVAGINRSTFYLHYQNPFDLLKELELDMADDIKTHFLNISTSYTSIEIIESFLEYIKENEKITRVLLCKNENLSFQKKIINILLITLQNNISINLIKPLAEYVYQFLLMGCFSIITTWINNDFNIKAKELSELIFDLAESARENF